MKTQEVNCTSCRYFVPQAFTVGVLFTNGKGWRIDSAMTCQKHKPCVKELHRCEDFEREPGAD